MNQEPVTDGLYNASLKDVLGKLFIDLLAVVDEERALNELDDRLHLWKVVWQQAYLLLVIWSQGVGIPKTDECVHNVVKVALEFLFSLELDLLQGLKRSADQIQVVSHSFSSEVDSDGDWGLSDVVVRPDVLV